MKIKIAQINITTKIKKMPLYKAFIITNNEIIHLIGDLGYGHFENYNKMVLKVLGGHFSHSYVENDTDKLFKCDTGDFINNLLLFKDTLGTPLNIDCDFVELDLDNYDIGENSIFKIKIIPMINLFIEKDKMLVKLYELKYLEKFKNQKGVKTHITPLSIAAKVILFEENIGKISYS